MLTVSTLIPVYNAEQYVANAVESVLAQRDVDVELIVIDDGSTDDTARILAQFGNRIRVLRQENAGNVAARNNGAKRASGEWLAFLDADDEWLPDKLARQLAVVDDTVGMVHTGTENFGDLSRWGRFHDTPACEGCIFEELLCVNFVTTSSVIIRKNWFDRLGGFDGSVRVCEDWDLWLRFAGAGGISKVCREPLTRYRLHAGQMSKNYAEMKEGMHTVLERALASPMGKRVLPARRRRARAEAWRCSAARAAPVRPWVAACWYSMALSYRPFQLDTYKQIVKCCIGRV